MLTKRWAFVGGFALTIALLVSFVSPSWRDGRAADLKPAVCVCDSAPAVSDKADFSGKILALRVVPSDRGQDELIPLENAQIRKMGKDTFLVGKQVNVRGEWLAGRTVWVKLDIVLTITEFASEDEFKKALSGASTTVPASSPRPSETAPGPRYSGDDPPPPPDDYRPAKKSLPKKK